MWHAVIMRIRPSALVLIAANLVPLAGVLWLGWSAVEVLLLYWTESVIVGAVNVLRMASAAPANPLRGMSGRAEQPGVAAATELAGSMLPGGAMKLFLIPFFIAHFGMFCFGHLSAVVLLVGSRGENGSLLGALPPWSDRLFWFAAGAIVLSHLFSFFANYLGRGEYRRTSLAKLMRQPYNRILAMHIAIVGSAVFVEKLDSPLPLLVILIAVKTGLDLKLHMRERRTLGDESAGNLIVDSSR